MTSVVEYDKLIRDKKAELGRLERDYKQQGNVISGKERTLKKLRENLSDLDGDISRETDELTKRKLEEEHKAITKSMESDIKAIETLKSERARLENEVNVAKADLSLLDSERQVQVGVERAEKYEAEVAAEFEIINNALSELSTKVNAIDKRNIQKLQRPDASY